jgi:hypothetical protein
MSGPETPFMMVYASRKPNSTREYSVLLIWN